MTTYQAWFPRRKALSSILIMGLLLAVLALSSCQSKGSQIQPASELEETSDVGLLDPKEKKREETVKNIRGVRKERRREDLQRSITEPLPKKKR